MRYARWGVFIPDSSAAPFVDCSIVQCSLAAVGTRQLVDKMKLNIADKSVGIADNIGSLLMHLSVALIACEMKTKEEISTEKEQKDAHT